MFAWTGATLFAASLLYFLFTYAVTFAEIAAGPLTATPIVLDAALFTAFALHHSVFARERVRARVARHFPGRAERSVYVWIASLMLITVCALWQPIPGVAWELRGPAAWVLRAVQVFGIWLTLRGAAVIDVWELSGVRQGAGGPEGPPLPTNPHDRTTPRGRRGGPSGPPADFRTDGPYGWVRHPIYLGWFLVVFAMPVMTMTRLVFAVVSCAYILIAIPFEERSLLHASGGAYQDYARKVPWKLVPRVH